MKLSSRKKLLKEADFTLKEIRKNVREGNVMFEFFGKKKEPKRLPLRSPQRMTGQGWSEEDWEDYEELFADPMTHLIPSYEETWDERMQWKYEKELQKIKDKYDKKLINVETMKEEVEELNRFLERLRKHMSSPIQKIPRDPEQQSNLQKMIMNSIPESIYENDFYKATIKDPETGMYYWRSSGLPAIPPEWSTDLALEYEHEVIEGGHKWDENRGPIYNIIMSLINKRAVD